MGKWNWENMFTGISLPQDTAKDENLVNIFTKKY